jgi:putative ABC transport system permease protein
LKKVILFLTIVFFICFNLIYFKCFSIQTQENVLYKNNTEISMVYNNTINTNDFIEKLKIESKNLKVNVSQYVYLDDNTLNIYSSNIENDSNIELIQGKYPKDNSDEYISNSLSNKTKKDTGKFRFPKSELNIKCYNFDQIKNVGFGNKFIISTNNKDSTSRIIKLLQQFGKVHILLNTHQNNSINIGLIPSSFTILIVYIFW